MNDTPNLALPYILAAQAQKHVTHNEAIRALDCLVQLSVESRSLTEPPATPVDGVRYLVAAAATGDWIGESDRIAAFQDGAWTFFEPREGWLAWVADEHELVIYSAGAWASYGGGSGGEDGGGGEGGGLEAPVANSSLANMATGTIKGRTSAGSGHPEDLSGAQATALLDTFGASGTSHKKGLVPDPGDTEGTTKFLREDGTWAEPPAGDGGGGDGISALVDDTSPQLGGQLDANGNAIGDGTHAILKFGETASAVNEVTITNAATGDGPTIAATGSDTNIDLNLAGKGTGGVKLPYIGINATGDTTNRFAVKSPASLFDNEGNGHQQKINKHAPGDTASVLYQTNYSGRAEMGLAGDDDFHFKVSPDGSTWHEALVIDRETGDASVTTQSARDNSTKVATTEYADAQVDQATLINTQTANYTAVLDDKGKTIEMNVGSANTFTIPPNSSVAFPVGTFFNVVQIGAGQTTIAAGSGVTIRNSDGLALDGQYALATLYKRATNEWVAGGALTS